MRTHARVDARALALLEHRRTLRQNAYPHHATSELDQTRAHLAYARVSNPVPPGVFTPYRLGPAALFHNVPRRHTTVIYFDQYSAINVSRLFFRLRVPAFDRILRQVV